MNQHFFRKLGTYQQIKMHSTSINQRYTNMLMIASQPSPDSTAPRLSTSLAPRGPRWHSYNQDQLWSKRGYDIGLQSMRTATEKTRGFPLDIASGCDGGYDCRECEELAVTGDVNSLLLKMAHRHRWFTRIDLLEMVIFQFVFCMSEMW